MGEFKVIPGPPLGFYLDAYEARPRPSRLDPGPRLGAGRSGTEHEPVRGYSACLRTSPHHASAISERPRQVGGET